MKLPTWSEFTAKLSQVEQDINHKVQELKKDHPLLDKAIKTSISFFPPPFDSIASKIYDSFDGSEEEKSAAVLNYFKYLQSQGEKHYNSVTSQLNDILNEIQDVKTITAKQSSVDKIQDILTSTGNTTTQKLNELVTDLKGVVIKVTEIDEKADVLLTQMKLVMGKLKVVEPNWTYGTVDVRISDFTSLVPDLFDKIQSILPVDYAIFDLGGGNQWLSTRLYLFTVILHRMRGLRRIVFVDRHQGIEHQFVGIAAPSQVQYALAICYPWLELAFSKAYGKLPPEIKTTYGSIDPMKADALVYYFLGDPEIQKVPPSFGTAPPEGWVGLGLPNQISKWEHADWLDTSKVMKILNGVLDRSQVRKQDLQGRSARDQAKSILSYKGDLVALVDEAGCFETLIDKRRLEDEIVSDSL